MTHIKSIVSCLALAGTLATSLNARADLASCWVLRTAGSQQGLIGQDVVAKHIFDAHFGSFNSDSSMLFVLRHNPALPSGAYEVQKVKLAYAKNPDGGESGYELSARDEIGLANAAIEVKQAFEAGRSDIFNLKKGVRKGLPGKPLLSREYEEKLRLREKKTTREGSTQSTTP